MIVNPQVFNYRFIIGSLMVAITILAAFSYNNYTSAQSKEDFFKQEKKLLENQISNVIISHDKLNELNNKLKLEVDKSKQIVSQIQDSLDELQVNISLTNKYRHELSTLKKQQSSLLKKEDSFYTVNNDLVKENTTISRLLNKQTDVISALKEEKAQLNSNLEKGALVFANSFEATAFFIKKSGDIIKTQRADKTNLFKVNFVLAENPLALHQEKEIFVQIIDPDNNVVADKGAIEFGNSSLIYSYKTNVFYNKKALNISVDVESNQTLKAGRYFITIFDGNRQLGSTQIILH